MNDLNNSNELLERANLTINESRKLIISSKISSDETRNILTTQRRHLSTLHHELQKMEAPHFRI